MIHNGKVIREWRNKIKLSQAKLAKLSGIKQAIISEWELGKKDPSENELILIDKIVRDLADKVNNGNIRLNEKVNLIRYDSLERRTPPQLNDTTCIVHNKHEPSHPENEDFLNTLNSLGKYVRNNEDINTGLKKPTGIALFSGCGGLSLGFKSAGYIIKGFVEIDEAAIRVYQHNFPGTVCLGKDITSINNYEINSWKEIFGHINVLFGGPPCQGFSLAGKRDPSDPRNNLYKDFLRIASILKPDVIMFENVRLMTSMKDSDGKLVLLKITKDFEDIGYKVSSKELNVRDYGVPQLRDRIIVICVNKDLKNSIVTFPNPTHDRSGGGYDKLFSSGMKKYVTFRDATFDLEKLESGERSELDPLHWAIVHPEHVIKWLKDVPEGHSAHENKDPSFRPSSGYNTTYKRIYWDEPCSTISTNFNMISGCRNVHPQNTRSFTIREATRCQTFPDNYIFVGSWGDIRRMIGNAVPPLFGRKIAEHIRVEYLF